MKNKELIIIIVIAIIISLIIMLASYYETNIPKKQEEMQNAKFEQENSSIPEEKYVPSNDIPFKLKYNQRKDLGIKKILGKEDNLKYDVYTFGGNVEITIQNETLPLEEAVRQNKITMENIIHQCILDSDPEYVQNPETECIIQKPQTHYYNDGGSVIYEYPEYSILKRFSLDGNRDIYIGMPGMILTGQEGNMVAYSR